MTKSLTDRNKSAIMDFRDISLYIPGSFFDSSKYGDYYNKYYLVLK